MPFYECRFATDSHHTITHKFLSHTLNHQSSEVCRCITRQHIQLYHYRSNAPLRASLLLCCLRFQVCVLSFSTEKYLCLNKAHPALQCKSFFSCCSDLNCAKQNDFVSRLHRLVLPTFLEKSCSLQGMLYTSALDFLRVNSCAKCYVYLDTYLLFAMDTI